MDLVRVMGYHVSELGDLVGDLVGGSVLGNGGGATVVVVVVVVVAVGVASHSFSTVHSPEPEANISQHA